MMQACLDYSVLQIGTGGRMQRDGATYSQTLSHVNIAVSVQLRNATRIAQ